MFLGGKNKEKPPSPRSNASPKGLILAGIYPGGPEGEVLFNLSMSCPDSIKLIM